MQERLELFNPINSSGTGPANQEFLDTIAEKIEAATEQLERLHKLREDNAEVNDVVLQAYAAIEEIGEREVFLKPEISEIYESLNTVNTDLASSEAEVQP